MDPVTGAMLGIGAAKTLFGGGQVKVPGAMARPTDPTSKFVDESGMLRKDFQTAGLSNEAMEQQKGLLGMLKDRATAQGPSQEAQYLQQAAGVQAQAQRDQMQRDMASQRATNEAQLAMKGGLGSGSRERMASGMATQGLLGGQDIARQKSLNNLNIQAQDEATKRGLLGSLAGQYGQVGQAQIGRQIADRQGGMGLLMDKYGRDMQAYGANQMAIAQADQYNAANRGLLGGIF